MTPAGGIINDTQVQCKRFILIAVLMSLLTLYTCYSEEMLVQHLFTSCFEMSFSRPTPFFRVSSRQEAFRNPQVQQSGRTKSCAFLARETNPVPISVAVNLILFPPSWWFHAAHAMPEAESVAPGQESRPEKLAPRFIPFAVLVSPLAPTAMRIRMPPSSSLTRHECPAFPCALARSQTFFLRRIYVLVSSGVTLCALSLQFASTRKRSVTTR